MSYADSRWCCFVVGVILFCCYSFPLLWQGSKVKPNCFADIQPFITAFWKGTNSIIKISGTTFNITFCMKKIFWKNYHFKRLFSPLYIHLLNDENISVVGLTKILMAEMSRANNSWTCQHKTDVSHQIDISHCHQLTSSYLSLVGNYRPILMFSPRIITAEVIHIEVGRED